MLSSENEQHIEFARIERNGEISTGIPCGTIVTTSTGDHIHTPKYEADLLDFENMAGLVDFLAEMIIWLSHSDKTSTGQIRALQG